MVFFAYIRLYKGAMNRPQKNGGLNEREILESQTVSVFHTD